MRHSITFILLTAGLAAAGAPYTDPTYNQVERLIGAAGGTSVPSTVYTRPTYSQVERLIKTVKAGGGCDTNAVDALANSAVVTNALTVATTNRVAALEKSKADKSVLDAKRALTNNTCSASEFGEWSIPKSHETFLSEPQPKWNGVQGIEWIWSAGSYMYQATGTINSTELDFYDPNPEVYDHFTSKRAAICSSNDTFVTWTPMTNAIARLAPIAASDPTFSNAVLAVGLNIDTNSVAVLNEIASTFGGFPIGGTATTVGGLLAALAAAIAWLRKRTAHLESDGTADNEFATDLFEKQVANVKANTDSLAAAYSETATYSVGDAVTHDGKLYKCAVAITTAETWTPAHWTEATVATLWNNADTTSYGGQN